MLRRAEDKSDLSDKTLDLTPKNRLRSGIGGHKLETIQQRVNKGIHPEFWMKTLHRNNYWSTSLKPEHNNNWCEDAEAVTE